MAKKHAWKVEPKLIDRFLDVLADNDFEWRTSHKANEFKPMWDDVTLLFIEEEPKTLLYVRYSTYLDESDEEYNITEVTEELLDEMESECATIDIMYYNQINHPRHYNNGGIETIDIIKQMLTEEEYRGFLKGNILKYRERAQHKGKPDEDYAKALWYYETLTEEKEGLKWL